MTLAPPFVEAASAFAAQPVVLVATDFDGVLAPLVLDPSTSRPLDGTIDSLLALSAAPATHAAVVSGRDLETLTALTGLDGSSVTRIASHGAQSSADAGPPALSPAQRDLLTGLTAQLDAVVADHPGARLEHKPSAVVLHTRGMEEAGARDAEEAALEVTTRHTEVHVLHGKHVVEVSVVRADKGSALMALRDAVGADAVAYFGDDVTDEHAFALLGAVDLGVKVGDGDTAAAHRLTGPPDVALALELLVRLRSGSR